MVNVFVYLCIIAPTLNLFILLGQVRSNFCLNLVLTLLLHSKSRMCI